MLWAEATVRYAVIAGWRRLPVGRTVCHEIEERR